VIIIFHCYLGFAKKTWETVPKHALPNGGWFDGENLIPWDPNPQKITKNKQIRA